MLDAQADEDVLIDVSERPIDTVVYQVADVLLPAEPD